MKLNHLDLQVPDVSRAAALFTRYFGFEWISNPRSPAIAILAGEGGFVLVLQRRQHPGEAYPAGFHLGFYVDAVEEVSRVQARARADGLIVSELIRNKRGQMIYLTTPDGLLIEVNCRT